MTASAPPTSSAIHPEAIAPLLLEHYDTHARHLPWRSLPSDKPPETPPDPYRIWLSEVMLQQTTVAAVIPYFKKFTCRWPDVEALAAAPEEDVMAAWAGLGYYSRARNLVACARAVAERGGFPEEEAELLKLPGLGTYTAAAIAAIAFGKRAVVVDANVERVVSRLFAIATPLPAARKEIRQATDGIVPDERAGELPKAYVVRQAAHPTLSAEQVKAHVAERTTSYKHLAHVEFVEAVPKSAAGKILRKELRALEAQRAGAAA